MVISEEVAKVGNNWQLLKFDVFPTGALKFT